MKTTLVTTTINIPHFLIAYRQDAQAFDQRDVDIIVIGDEKTPLETMDFCDDIPTCHYVSLLQQEVYLKRFPELSNHIPYNSFERRDVGLLMAYENGADVIITIDDDNLLAAENALLWYKQAGQTLNIPVYRSSSGWFNVCSMLKEENGVEFYHRGYSPRHRWEKNAYISSQKRDAKIVVNAGLWYNNPDTDAITRLERKLNVTGFGGCLENTEEGTFGLAPGTWSPFNCQNTALAREVIPSYFMSPYIGRHSDIFASYVVNRIAEHFGDVIAFGMPLANHARSEHNLWHDLDIEREGMQRTDKFCDALRAIKVRGTSYHDAFGYIARELKGFDKITTGMKIWHDVFNKIGVQ